MHGPESSAPAGTLEAFAVGPRLRESVGQILLYRETIPRGVEVLERVLPDGLVRLVVELGARPAAIAIGASTAPALVRMRGRIEGMSIAIRPGAAAAILGVPAFELEGRVVPLDDVWRGERVLERVASARDDAERVAIVQSILERRASRGVPTAARAARILSRAGGRRTVRDVAAEIGIGERRLQQLFQAHVGLSPRAWSRLARLHHCLRALRARSAPTWAGFAAEHGFYDQSHLVNEIRALCGLTPTELLRRVVSGSSKTAP